jgi:hypothetical protein
MIEPFEHCLNCKHQLLTGCKAFPEGIPFEFAEGEKVHDKITKDQTGTFVFKKGLSDLEIEINEMIKQQK